MTPPTMRAWQFSSTKGGLENNLTLNKNAPLPKPANNEHLVQVLAAALNPMDCKPAEVPIVHFFAFSKPSVPAVDFAGRIIRPAADSDLKAGQLIFGSASANPISGGALAEYAAVPSECTTLVPANVSVEQAASIPMAGVTAWQATHPYMKKGLRVFINGGSSAVGSFAVQIAKLDGAHVTASCSAANLELVQALGADRVLDYKSSPLVEQLRQVAKGDGPFDLVIDCVGGNQDVYWRMPEFTKAEAKYIYVGWGPSLSVLSFVLKAKVLPTFGRTRREMVLFTAKNDVEALDILAERVANGSIKVLIDSTFEMEAAVAGYTKLKTGRARGKVVVRTSTAEAK